MLMLAGIMCPKLCFRGHYSFIPLANIRSVSMGWDTRNNKVNLIKCVTCTKVLLSCAFLVLFRYLISSEWISEATSVITALR